MRFKSTTVLFLLFLVLGGYVYIAEFRGKEDRQKQEEATKKAVQVDAKSIKEISLIYPHRTITAVRKDEKDWQMTSHSGLQADSEEWDQLAASITRVRREETVQENVQDLTPFGLKDPPIRVNARLADGKSIEILFGSDNPRKTFTYAKVSGSSDVFLTPTSSKSLFTKTLSDLRNKKVLEFEPADVSDVKISEGGKELEVQESGGKWQIKKPVDTMADVGEAPSFIASIRSAQASFPDPPVDAKTAGLEPPALKITLQDGQTKADHVLLVGKKTEGETYYARDAARDPVFTIGKEIVEKARRPVFDWRDKTITQLQRDKIDEVIVQRGADKSSFRKVNDDWKLPDGRKLQWDKVSAILSTLEFEKAKDIIDMPKALSAYGLDKPRLEVDFRQGANGLGHLSLGSDSKNPEGIYAKASDRSSIIVVPKSIFENFNVKVEDLVEAPAQEKPGSDGAQKQ